MVFAGGKTFAVLDYAFDIPPAEVARFFAMPILAIFGNDYRTVTTAFKEARFVPENSKLGSQYSRFAQYLAGEPEVQEVNAGVSKIRRIFSPARSPRPRVSARRSTFSKPA